MLSARRRAALWPQAAPGPTREIACVVCRRTLREADFLAGCYLCRSAVMCEHHIGGYVTAHDDRQRPICPTCAARPA